MTTAALLKMLARNSRAARGSTAFLLIATLAVGCARQQSTAPPPAPEPQITAPAPSPQKIEAKDPARLKALGDHIDAVFNQPEFNGARWGVMVRSYDTGEVVYARNETQTFAPASNEKLFTTIGALMLLGPDYRYTTKFYTTGNVDIDGVVHGDLIVQGNGNFCLGDARPETDTEEQLREQALKCRTAGIKEIKGDLVGDDTWADPQLSSRWAGSIVLNENQFSVTLSDGGEKMQVTPASAPVKIIDRAERGSAEPQAMENTDNSQRRRGSGLRLRRVEENSTDYVAGQRTYELVGRIAPGESRTANGTIGGAEAVQYYLETFRNALAKEGVVVHGTTRVLREKGADYDALMAGSTARVEIQSPPLSEILAWINKPSDNYLAERLFITCGQRVAGLANHANGETAVKQELARLGVQPENYELADGSGLSRDNQVRPVDIVALLDAMRVKPFYQQFYDSLPIAGVDGTIRSRMKGTPAENNVRAKTGHIRGVTALSGYATSKDGERFTFAMIVNNNPGESSVPDNAENEVAAMIAGFER